MKKILNKKKESEKNIGLKKIKNKGLNFTDIIYSKYIPASNSPSNYGEFSLT